MTIATSPIPQALLQGDLATFPLRDDIYVPFPPLASGGLGLLWPIQYGGSDSQGSCIKGDGLGLASLLTLTLGALSIQVKSLPIML